MPRLGLASASCMVILPRPCLDLDVMASASPRFRLLYLALTRGIVNYFINFELCNVYILNTYQVISQILINQLRCLYFVLHSFYTYRTGIQLHEAGAVKVVILPKLTLLSVVTLFCVMIIIYMVFWLPCTLLKLVKPSDVGEAVLTRPRPRQN